MGRKLRVHELAKELGVETKDLIAKLEGLGYPAKRPQSALEDEEIERVKSEYGRSDRPAVTVGDERVLHGGEGETVVERRVKTNVIRRRTTRQPGVDGDGNPANEPLESFSSADNLPPPVAAPVPAGALPLGDVGETTSVPLPPFTPPPPPPAEPVIEAAAPEAAPPQPAAPPPPPPSQSVIPTPSRMPADRRPLPGRTGITRIVEPKPLLDDSVQRGPKVLGKIDLRKTQPPPPADPRTSRERPKREVFAPASPAAPAQPPSPTEADNRRKKKRRVIKEADAGELKDDQRGRSRLPRKKRALPGKDIKKTEITTPKASKRVVKVSGVITVGDLAKAMGVKAAEILKKLMDSGMLATINQLLDADTATLLASDFGYNVENVAFDAESVLEEEHEETTEENAQPRPPVVTIMGHVDHGKTSLLDAIRSTNVTEQEHGGITQHIGAYSVEVGSRRVTFLETPGHEAFTAMRARGAKVTDLVVLVVAADDGVMPQTIEAINHARAASVPIVVAINKVDKPEADLERTRQLLADHGLVAEEWGGDTVCAPVSAKTRDGIPHLLEMLLLQADLLDLKARPDKLARGTIVEAKLDRGRGPVATVLVQEGTLKKGDPFVCGGNYGRVRAMVDDRGRSVTEAGPSTPVEILGLQGVPDAGSKFVAVADEATARQVAEHRRTKQREAELAKTAKVSLEDLYSQVQSGEVKELKVVVKADVQGSVEALSDALVRLSTPEVRLNVIHQSVGGITETDVLLASASNAVVIGFNIRPEAKASEVAEREGVDVRLYNIIYDVQNDLQKAMEGLLEPTLREKVVGRAEVRQVFSIPNMGVIAGSYVVDGKIVRNSNARLVRDHVVVYTGKVASLRRFKEDAREVQSGYECGIGLEDYLDIKAGDTIETYEMETVERRLSQPTQRPAFAERRA